MDEHGEGMGTGEVPEADVERLRAERDDLQARVQELEDRPGRRSRLRRGITPALVVLTVLVFTITVPAAWGNRTVLNTDRYVATVAPLAEDPAVQASIAEKVTDQVFAALDVQGKLGDLLPDNLAILAAPMTNAVQDFVQDQVLKVVQSDAFATFWVEANRFVHTQILAILEGEGETVSVVEGKVLLNLMPLVNLALAQIQGVASDLVGRDVTIPPVTPGMLPDRAVAALEDALGVDLPDDFGSIEVYDSEDLAALQQGLYVFQRALVLLVVLIPILVALTLWVSPRKRRTLIQLAAGATLGLVLIRRGALLLREDLFDSVDTERFPGVRVLANDLTESLFRYTAVLLAIVVITLLVALITGPYPWAVAFRGWVRDAGRSVGAAIGGAKLPETDRARWIGAHRDGLMLAVAVVAILLLFFVDLSAFWFWVVAAATAVLEFALARMRREEPEPAEAS
jgi:hypothetical protein